MPLPPNPHSRPGPGWTFPVLALVVGVLGAAAAWSVVYLWLRGPAAWMGLLAAADMALMLRLAAAPPGRGRAVLATIGTASAIAIGLWMVAATQMALLIGITPLESAQRLGPVLAGELLRHGTDGWDVAMLVLSLPLAWRLGR